MAVGTSDGQYFEDEFDYQHHLTFGEQQPKQPEVDDPKLFLVRHGDTNLNDEDLVHGWVDAPLNDNGIEQAHKAAESLKDKEITRIISSDLPRAKQTANIIGKKLGIPVTFDPNLRTWDSGDFDYTNKHDELKKYTHVAVVDSVLEMTDEPNQDVAPPGSSESFSDFTNRVLSTITNYASNNEGHNTLLVTHSKPIKAFNAWEHAGYPEEGDIHLPTYEKDLGTGRVQEVDIPQQAQEAREMAAQRLIQSTVPGYRNEGKATQWTLEQGQSLVNTAFDILKHPENIVGTGELGMAVPKGSINETITQMRAQGSTWKQIAEEVGMSLAKVYRYANQEGLSDKTYNKISNKELAGKRGVPGAPLRWTKEYGYPGSAKWRAAFDPYKRSPKEPKVSEEEQLKAIMEKDSK